MIAGGLVSRNATATRPVSSTYRLTDLGREVAAALTRLREVAESRFDT